MSKNHFGRSKICAKFSEIIVLSLSFLLFALFSSNVDINQILISATIYSFISLFFMRLSRVFLSKVANSSIGVFNLLAENFIGLLVGSIIAFNLINLLMKLDNVIMILVFSSIMTFFVLGTFSPLMETPTKNIARR